MTRSKLFAALSLDAVLPLSAAYAQAPAPGGQQPPPGAPSGPPGPPYRQGPGLQAPSTDSEGVPWPILYMVSIEVLRTKDGRDLVVARGLTSSSTWSNPRLVPINQGPPVDGVLDLLFEADAPKVPAPAPLGDFMEVDALLPIGHQHPYKAIRVRSASNALTLKTVPGYVEVKKLKNDCAKCVGKYFVAKGGTAPAGVPADNIVKEEDLLWQVRVIKPNEGIPSYTLSPNRLTLVLTDDGRISDAGWD